MRARIYAEGGGNGQFLDTLFRQAWSTFFMTAGLAGRMPKVIRGKGRAQTFDMFVTAIQTARPGEVPLLLVDAEDAIAPGHSVWQHLKTRDNWDKPGLAANDQAFLMVRIMETWFLADRTLLRDYFGPQLREQHLRQWPALEEVPKQTVLTALEQATAGCQRQYAKGKVSYELLRKVNPALVETECPHAMALLVRLRAF